MNFRSLASAARPAALALAGLTLAASCFAQTVKIGMVNSLTGPHSSFDLPASEGVLMAIDEINKRGGITVQGRKFTFAAVSEDAQSKPEMAVSGAQRLLRDDDIRVIFGILTSGPGMAAATAIGKSDVLYVGGFTLMDTLLGKPGADTMFRSLNNDATVAKSFVPTSVKELGVKQVGIMLPNEDVSRSIVARWGRPPIGHDHRLVHRNRTDVTQQALGGGWQLVGQRLGQHHFRARFDRECRDHLGHVQPQRGLPTQLGQLDAAHRHLAVAACVYAARHSLSIDNASE